MVSFKAESHVFQCLVNGTAAPVLSCQFGTMTPHCLQTRRARTLNAAGARPGIASQQQEATDRASDLRSIPPFTSIVGGFVEKRCSPMGDALVSLQFRSHISLAQSVEHRRGLLFDALHPNRDELDAEEAC